MVQWEYGDVVISTTIKFLSLSKAQMKTSQILLELCSKIIDEANHEMTNLRKISFRKDSEMEVEDYAGSESQKIVKYILEKIKECEDNQRKDLAKKLIKLLPFCSKDEYLPSKFLFEYFQLDRLSEVIFSPKMPHLIAFMDSLSESYESFKIVCRDSGTTDQILAVISESLGARGETEEKKTYRSNQKLEMCLILLKGLIRGDQVLQKKLFEEKLFEQIEGIVNMQRAESEANNFKTATTVCYEIMKYFSEGRLVNREIQNAMKAKEQEASTQKTLKRNKKMEILKSKKDKIYSNYLAMIDQQNPDPEVVVCSSCREGVRNNFVMGVYLYSSKIEVLCMDSWWKEKKKIPGITSVSYFMPIHYECHLKALEADQKLRKAEWEGALIRNSDVLCNNWIPFKLSNNSDDDMARVSKKYFERNNKTGSFWTVLNDLNGLFEKFSREYNFSEETKGSSASHNCKLLLVLIGFTAFQLKNSEDVKYLREGCTFIEENLTRSSVIVNLYFCSCLFIYKLTSWEKRLETCLKVVQKVGEEFKARKPHYIYLVLVNQVFKLIHTHVQEDKSVAAYVDSFIPQNLSSLVSAFERLAEDYCQKYSKIDAEDKFLDMLKN